MSSPGTNVNKNVADPEGINQHVEHHGFVDEKELEGGISQHIETQDFIDEEELKGDIDIAATALRGQDLSHFTEEERRKVLRKIDWHILPLAAWSCGLQFVDKSGLGAAATYGLQADLGLHGNQYSWCVSMFYFGYLAGTFFAGRALQRFHAGKVIGICFFLWGITLLGCSKAHNYGTLIALRFILGILESSLVPGLLLITTMWYTPREQPFRFGVWTFTNGALPVPFIVIYYALGHVKTGPLVSWRLIFLLIGLLSCVTGVVLYFFMPDSPISVKWLNDRERAIAVQRVADHQLGVKNNHLKWEQIREALTDYRTWLMVSQMFLSQAIGNTTTNFLGIIIKGFGYSPLKAQLYTAPNSAIQAVMTLAVTAPPSIFPRFRNMRQPLAAAASLVAVAGCGILFAAPGEPRYQKLRLGGCMMLAFSGVNYAVVMSVVGSNVAGFTKKQFTTSWTFFLYCVINIVTPQTFLGSEAPRYHTGLTFVLILTALYVITSLATWAALMIENKRRDRLAVNNPDYRTGDENLDHMSGLRDQTDKENKHHRFSG